jgi:YVTN family beta-propeller protein
MKVPQIWSASQSVGSWVTAVAMAVLGASPGDAVSRAMSDLSQSNSESKSSSMQHIEHNGLAVDVSISQLDTNGGRLGPLVGQPAMVQVTLTDARTGAPVVGIRPRAWMNSRPSDMVADEVACTDKIRRLMSGRLGSRADIDLNRYVILAMNHDRTISIIDPFLDFSPTKLESLVTLPSVGLDWVLTQDQNALYVSMPDVDEVAVIDTRTRKLLRTLETGPGSRPGRILLQPDGRHIWVGLDGSDQLAVFDASTHNLIETVTVEAGLHTLASTPDSRFVYVTNGTADTVSAVDAQTFTVLASMRVGKTPVALTYSPAARRFYVGSLNGNEIAIIDPQDHRISGHIPTVPGVVMLAVEPEGRFVFAANQIESRLSVVDTAINRVIASAAVVKGPDQIRFTERYAYVRGIESEKFTLLDLREARKGNVMPLDLQAGLHAPSGAPEQLGIAPMIVPTPEGNGAIIANAPDATLHLYQEGMMAPMGTFSNYKRMPRGILVLDRSLKEVAPGVYRAPVTFTKVGRYDVPLLIDRPRTMHCFQVTVKDSEIGVSTAAVPKPPIVRTHFGTEPVQARVPTALAFTLTDPATQQPIMGIRDVQVLLFEPPGTWQHRQHAREVEPGRYAITQSFPHAGEYRVMVQTLSQRLRYADGVPAVLQVVSSTVQSTKQMQRAAGRRP